MHILSKALKQLVKEKKNIDKNVLKPLADLLSALKTK